MPYRKGISAVSALIALFGSPAALALGACDVGDLCTIQSDQFGCKNSSLIKRWIDLNIEESRAAAEKFIAGQVEAGQCARFKSGDRLRIARYLGMRRVEVERAGETARYIMLLK